MASAYRRSLEVALENGVQTLAFPAISTGAYGYPLTAAAPIALQTVCDFAAAHTKLRRVRFVLFDYEALNAYERTLTALAAQRSDLRLT